MEKKDAIQFIWNSMNPMSRKPVLDRLMLNPDQYSLDFYKNLDLDSRVEFLSTKSEEYKKKFWAL